MKETNLTMSRRKQSRPRHVDNEEISPGADDVERGLKELGNHGRVTEGGVENLLKTLRTLDDVDDDTDGDEKINGIDNREEFCPSDEAPSPSNREDIPKTCSECGICFTDVSLFSTHMKLCSGRILMPYDAPVNAYPRNMFDRGSLDGSLDIGSSDEDDKHSESVDEEDRIRASYRDYNNEEVRRKRKRTILSEEDDDDDDEKQYRTRSDKTVIVYPNTTDVSLYNVRQDSILGVSVRKEHLEDQEQYLCKDNVRRWSRERTEEDPLVPLSMFPANGKDPAIAWAIKAAERGLFGDINESIGPATSTNETVAHCVDGLPSMRNLPDEVSMFRAMVFQLQQQQMMQIQMIQQMKRQLIASGVNPSMLPGDLDLKLMSSEGLASVGAAMSGLHNARLAAAGARDSEKFTSPSGDNRMFMSPFQEYTSRSSSPLLSETSAKSSESPATLGNLTDKDLKRSQAIECETKEDPKWSFSDLAEKYNTSGISATCSKDQAPLSPQTKSPLQLLQERTAASFPSGLGSSFSTVNKPSSSSLLNSNALFASSPSLSALQKETDALKPPPILHPLSVTMTPEDYKGYIQRGTILERSQYASDDPFFKHKCRFCHKVFGSDSALQIHVRSHTGERPFKCNICGNRFSTKGNLKVHFERHKAKYPHIKMDATPVPEHLDRQPNLLPNCPPIPIPPSLPRPSLPPRPPPIPPVSQVPASSPSSTTFHPSHSKHSPYPLGFGGPFFPTIAPGFSPFSLMIPPRDGVMPFPHPLRMSLLPSMGIPPLPSERDSHTLREYEICTRGTSVIRPPRKSSPERMKEDGSYDHESLISPPVNHSQNPDKKNQSEHHDIEKHPSEQHHSDDHQSGSPDVSKKASFQEEKGISQRESEQDVYESHKESDRSRSPSPFRPPGTSNSLTPGSAYVPLPRPSSCRSSLPSPVSVISWASMASPQPVLLPSHHTPFFPPHHLPQGFPGLGLPLPGVPHPFPLPRLNPLLSIPCTRVNDHSPYLPPHPQTYPPQRSPTPDDEPGFRSSSLPTKTIDPSENLEQYMEVQKSETSKLEALVKNIEQKITDPNQCVICHRVLSCKSALQMHYRIHTGERPFKCKICGRSFTTKGNLKTHMGVHRAKPALRMMHQCPVCHKQFTNVLVLQQHIRAHTGSMHHMPHLPLLSSHMDWPHRSPFGLNRNHQYINHINPLHHESPSLDITRGNMFNPNHSPEIISHNLDRLNKPTSDNAQDNFAEKSSWAEKDCLPNEDAKNYENSSRPQSRNNGHCDDKDQTIINNPISFSDDNLAFPKQQLESTFLPPAFGNTSFDTPLAALEEKVKSIDSQLSQTSFKKFRNSMGLVSTLFPRFSTSSNRGNNSESGSDSASKPESPGSEGEMLPNDLERMPSFGKPRHNSLTCRICSKTFESQSALTMHYWNHSKANFQCEACDQSFSSKDSLKQHLLTHTEGDRSKTGFHDNSNNSNDSEDLSDKDSHYSDMKHQDIDNRNEHADENYPYEDDDAFVDEDLGVDDDQEDDIDDMPETFNESPKSGNDSQEDNNEVCHFQNNNGDRSGDASHEKTTGQINGYSSLSVSSSESQNSSSQLSEASNKPTTSGPSECRSHLRQSPSAAASIHTGSCSGVTRSSGPKHQCMTCMKPFSSASALQIHTRTHTGDKPFKCTVCSKAFTTRGNLKVHMSTHAWNNSPSRRGRRMSIEPPFLMSHMKDNPFMLPSPHIRPSTDFLYQHPMSLMNNQGPKLPDFSGIQSLNGAIHTRQSLPPHISPGYLFKENHSSPKDIKTTPGSPEPKSTSDLKPSPEKLDQGGKISSMREASPSLSSPSTNFSLLSAHPPSTTSSSTPSHSNNKENTSSGFLDLQKIRSGSWLWEAYPCRHCGYTLPTHDALQHHIKVLHMDMVEATSLTLSKAEPHTSLPPKALVA